MFNEFRQLSSGQKLAVVGVTLLLFGFSYASEHLLQRHPSTAETTLSAPKHTAP